MIHSNAQKKIYKLLPTKRRSESVSVKLGYAKNILNIYFQCSSVQKQITSQKKKTDLMISVFQTCVYSPLYLTQNMCLWIHFIFAQICVYVLTVFDINLCLWLHCIWRKHMFKSLLYLTQTCAYDSIVFDSNMCQ